MATAPIASNPRAADFTSACARPSSTSPSRSATAASSSTPPPTRTWSKRRSGALSRAGCSAATAAQPPRAEPCMASETGPEPDRLEDAPHPREQLALFGHEAAERAFLEAAASGRLHHAWLIRGAKGVGKATLAYRMARMLLAQPRTGAPARTLEVAKEHSVQRLIAAQAHPN